MDVVFLDGAVLLADPDHERETELGLALVVRIRKEYGTIEEDDIHSQDESM